MQGEQQALLILAPAPAAMTGVPEHAQSLPLAAATADAMQVTPMPAAIAPDGTTPSGVFSGGYMRFIWLPTVAGEIVRLCWAPTEALAVATASDRAFAPGVEYSVWVDRNKAWVGGLSAGGGELSWNLG